MNTARLILYVMAASYAASAGLLLYLRSRGETVPWYWPAAWVVAALATAGSAAALADGRAWAWWACLLAAGPILLVSAVVDARQGNGWVVGLDVAGLAAVGVALWQARGGP